MASISRRLRLAYLALRYGRIPVENRSSIPSITGEEIEEIRAFFPLPKFFIFGHARSGTTLLTRLVRTHHEVHCNYQGHFFTRKPLLESLIDDRAVEEWLTRRSNRWNQGGDLSPLVLRASCDFIMEREARPLGAKVVGDKSPNSLLDGLAVEKLHKVYPDGRLIFIVRDGRDAAVSHRFQTFIDAPQHLNRTDKIIRQQFLEDPDPFLKGERSIFTERSIRQAAEGWQKNVIETDREAQRLFPGQYLSLRYEDLLAEPRMQIFQIWDFLGVSADLPELNFLLEEEMSSNPDAAWQRQKAGDLVEPLQKGKTGSWKDLFTQNDREIFKRIAGDALVQWEYEKDLNW